MFTEILKGWLRAPGRKVKQGSCTKHVAAELQITLKSTITMFTPCY